MHKTQDYAVGCNIKGAWKSPSSPYKQERRLNIAKMSNFSQIPEIQRKQLLK